MGKTWDGWESPASFQRWCTAWAAECLRVLRPGGHMLAFGGTRTFHRLACAIEDAGFEIRDSIGAPSLMAWVQGQGFPKSLGVERAIDKLLQPGVPDDELVSTPEGDEWQGWGTALRPAWEPIVVARKPLDGTVAANVQRHGTGAINIDASRVNPGVHVPGGGGLRGGAASRHEGWQRPAHLDGAAVEAHDKGRWPANVVLTHASAGGVDLCADGCVDGCPVRELDQQAGPVGSNSGTPNRADGSKSAVGIYSPGAAGGMQTWETRQPGASRFFHCFRFEAKAPTSERPRVGDVAHSTVKPLDLMRWLVRLVTPPGGTVLDPFAGSGTTGEACIVEGFHAILIEREAAYLPLITARLTKPIELDLFGGGAA